MCGIAGCVLRPGRTPDPAVLRLMADALAHRGPDDVGVEVVGSVGLAHTRLSIVDPSPAGHQPMRGRGGRWWLTYNGEIFNHRELRSGLEGREFAGGSDTETLLALLEHEGERAIERANGLFAYAALDCERRRLLLVRDRFGVKPLYVARHDDGIWFASEIGALLAVGVARAPDRELARHAVAYGWVNGPQTPIAAVRRLLPGTAVEVGLDDLETREWTWYAPAAVVDRERAAALAHSDHDALLDTVEETLRTAVRRRLMADVPVGTMCSGGLDSSLVAALARDEHPNIQAFNASVADQPEVDEGPWARTVADALGIELHTVDLTAASWRSELVETVRHTEYPLTHESSVPMAGIARMAREAGVKVLLSGEGADELYGGYAWAGRREYENFAAGHAGVKNRTRAVARALRDRLPGGRPPDPRGAPAPAAAAFEQQAIARAEAAYGHHSGPRRALEARCLADLSTYLPHLLNRQDKNTMQCSIETRVPFLDPDVVALALNLPLEARVLPRRKEILREIGARHLPAAIGEREKIGFGFDVGRYLGDAVNPGFLADGGLRECFGAPLQPWREAVLRLDGVSALRFWTGEIWYRLLVDGNSVSTVEAELWRGAR